MTDRNALVEQYAHLVPLTVKRMVPSVPLRIDVGDLHSAGYLGLIAAADRFDPARGTAFKSLAITWIRGSILQELRDEDWVPRSVREKQKRGEPVTVLEQISLEQTFYGQDPDEDHDYLKLRDQLVDPAPGPEEQALASARAKEMGERLNVLHPSSRQIVRLYYEHGMTFREIGKRIGRSESVTQWIHKQALAKLKLAWEQDGLQQHPG